MPQPASDEHRATETTHAEPGASAQLGRLDAWIVVGLWLVVLAVFGRVVGDPFSSMDDARFILINPEIVRPGDASLADLLLQPHIGYIVPLTGLVEAALYALGDGAAWPFHLLGVLLHATSASLLFALVRRFDAPAWAATLAAACFALHPVVVEPVAWATGLKDLLMAALALGATLSLVHAVQRRRWLRLAALFGVLAVLAKPTGAFVGLAWAGYLLARNWRGDGASPRAWRVTLAVLAFGALVTLASWHMHSTLIVDDEPEALEGDWQAPLALGHELAHLAWPADLFPRYPIVREAGFDDPHTAWGILGAVAFVALAWTARRRPAAALGLGLALATYLPVSNLVPFPRMVADSYLYTPLAGLMLAAGPGIAWVGARHPPWARRITLTAGALVVLALGVRTAEQVRRWGSPVDLWYPAVAADPQWTYAWSQMGDGLRFRGDHERALHVYEQMFARVYSRTYLHKVALTLLHLERFDEAECVLAEDAYHGENRERAIHNLALFVASHPEREPAYPYEAAMALAWASGELKAGELRWPPELEAALPARFAALAPQLGIRGGCQTRAGEEREHPCGDEASRRTKPLKESPPVDAWPPRACPSLQRDPIPGPP